jgi:ketosteroid isomerase-like protein
METNKTAALKLRNGILAILLQFLFLNFATAQIEDQVSLDFPSETEAMETAKNTVEAYEMGDWETIRNNVTADATFYNLGTYDSLDVDQTIDYWKKGRETATPVLADDGAWLAVGIAEGPRKGNWVLHWGNNTLSYPNGETVSFPYHVALKMQNDKVEEVHFYYDNNRIIRAMGYEILTPINEEEDSENMNDGFD